MQQSLQQRGGDERIVGGALELPVDFSCNGQVVRDASLVQYLKPPTFEVKILGFWNKSGKLHCNSHSSDLLQHQQCRCGSCC